MKKTNKVIAVIMLIIITAFTVSSVCVNADSLGSGTQRVFDDYDLLTDDEEANLQQALEYMRSQTGMDYVILTTDANSNGLTTEEFADDFYDSNGFSSSGILYLIDMEQRNYYISTAGDMIPYFTDSRIEEVCDAAYSSISSGEYYNAFSIMLQYTESYINAGVPSDARYGDDDYYYDGYDYYSDGDYYGQESSGFPSFVVIAAIIIGVVVAVIKYNSVNTAYGMLGSTYKYDLDSNTEVEISESRDEYIRSDVVRVPRDNDNRKSGGRMGGGHSGGSHISSHSSSHGVSHGGGGRHF